MAMQVHGGRLQKKVVMIPFSAISFLGTEQNKYIANRPLCGWTEQAISMNILQGWYKSSFWLDPILRQKLG